MTQYMPKLARPATITAMPTTIRSRVLRFI
jgi:hypothetical protein